MTGQRGFWDFEQRLEELSAEGDPLEKLSATVDFEMFRPILLRALRRGKPRGPGGRPPYDPVLKFKMLVLQALHGLSLAQTSYLVRDRLSWMRFCGLGPGDAVPDENTLWDFREVLIETKALDKLFSRLDAAINAAGFLPMGGQIVDATLVAAPKQRNTEEEREQIKAGRIPQAWKDKPAKLRQKDTDARWTVKYAKARKRKDGKTQPDIAIPFFGYKSHIGIDHKHGIIRREKTTDASRYDGARLREGLIDPNNTASGVWADTAYRSKANEAYLEKRGKKSRIHHKKPRGRPMPERMRRANAAKSKVRARVEHVFAEQKARMGLFIRTIGIKRAEAAITLANMAYNMKRWCWLERRSASA
ncbi:MAG: IS5 family transposase [Mariprofundaceae bacterium]|nr:IS5 family transposase [Mariprofundaceae bacterium]